MRQGRTPAWYGKAHDLGGFGESAQEGVVETVQEFALDIYNNLRGEDQQISGQNIELFVCDYTMQFLASLQKRAEGAPFAQAVLAAENDDGCQWRHERHIMNDRVSVDYDMWDDYNII